MRKIIVALIATLFLYGLSIPISTAAGLITGTATKCTAPAPEQCYYVIAGKTGNGFAQTNSYFVFFQLPGEAKETVGQPFHWHAASVTGSTTIG
jgi:hypothetical protein